jgi:hypothetical protein
MNQTELALDTVQWQAFLDGFYDNREPLRCSLPSCLFDAGQGAILLSPGIHSFPFKLGLPLGLPSTFLGKHGWVQYYCKAALREPNGLTHKNQQVFIVMNPIDLNLEPPILAVSDTQFKAVFSHIYPCSAYISDGTQLTHSSLLDIMSC